MRRSSVRSSRSSSRRIGVNPDQNVLCAYSKVAGAMNMKTAADVRLLRERTAERLGISFDELMQVVGPMEDIYVVCDYSRALAFMLNDGVVPSNVREGYFARMLVRRASVPCERWISRRRLMRSLASRSITSRRTSQSFLRTVRI